MRIHNQSAPILRKNMSSVRKISTVGIAPQQLLKFVSAEDEEEYVGRIVKPGGGRIARFAWCRFGPQGGSREECASQANE